LAASSGSGPTGTSTLEQEMASTADDIVARTRRAQLALALRAVASASQEGGGARRGKRGRGGKARKARRGEHRYQERTKRRASRAHDVERREGGGHVEADSDRGKGPRRKAPKRGRARTPDGEGRWLDPTIRD
jgi:hypothetical protein